MDTHPQEEEVDSCVISLRIGKQPVYDECPIGIAIHGLRSGDVVYGGQALFDVDETVVNDGWFSVGNSVETKESNAKGMSNIDYKMEGRIVLPPNGQVSMHVGCNDSNPTFQVGMSWYEVPLDLG